jgi:3-hydroxy-9,10-secoandrosta-1,3,5(10)-triene-9,17-dione monooxygenase reductase component
MMIQRRTGRSSRPDPASLRTVLGTFATGVTVVTAATPDGPVGMTANSFTSVSLEPPLVLFCAARSSGTYPHIERARAFAVNILARGQEHVGAVFAKQGVNRFAHVKTRTEATGAPILTEAMAYLECRISDRIERGDHVIVLGQVESLGVQQDDCEPLVFFRGGYHEPSPQPVSQPPANDPDE